MIEALPDTSEKQPYRLLERRELSRLLNDSIGRMPKVECAVLRMYYQEGMTLRQIAQVAQLHESRICQLKTQAIRRLRTGLARQWPTPRGL